MPAREFGRSEKRVRRRRADLADCAALNAKLQGLHPRREIFGQGGLECLDVYAAWDSKLKCLPASSWCSCDPRP